MNVLKKNLLDYYYSVYSNDKNKSHCYKNSLFKKLKKFAINNPKFGRKYIFSHIKDFKNLFYISQLHYHYNIKMNTFLYSDIYIPELYMINFKYNCFFIGEIKYEKNIALSRIEYKTLYPSAIVKLVKNIFFDIKQQNIINNYLEAKYIDLRKITNDIINQERTYLLQQHSNFIQEDSENNTTFNDSQQLDEIIDYLYLNHRNRMINNPLIWPIARQNNFNSIFESEDSSIDSPSDSDDEDIDIIFSS